MAVFVYHYGVGEVLAKLTGWSGFKLLAVPGAVYAVPLFFLVSGYCIHRSQFKHWTSANNFVVANYFHKRFWRIYPAYLAALLFSCSVLAIERTPVDPWDFLIHCFLLQSFFVDSFNSINLVLWTISVEALFYVLYPAWLMFRIRFGLVPAVVLGLGVSATSWLVSSIWFYPYNYPTLWFVLNLWGAWISGAALTELVENRLGFLRGFRWWVSGFCYALLIFAASQTRFFASQGKIIWASVITIAWMWPLSLLILAEPILSKSQGLFGKACTLLSFFGKISYSLYLIHMPAMYFRNVLWQDVSSNPLRSVIWAIYFVAVILLSWLMYCTFEKPFVGYRSKQQ